MELIASGIDAGMKEFCPNCGGKLIGLASTSNMQPDTLWAGKRIPHLINEKGTDVYTGEGQVKAAMKANKVFMNEAGVDRDIERNADYKKDAQRQRVRGKLEKMVADIPAGYRIKTV